MNVKDKVYVPRIKKSGKWKVQEGTIVEIKKRTFIHWDEIKEETKYKVQFDKDICAFIHNQESYYTENTTWYKETSLGKSFFATREEAETGPQ